VRWNILLPVQLFAVHLQMQELLAAHVTEVIIKNCVGVFSDVACNMWNLT